MLSASPQLRYTMTNLNGIFVQLQGRAWSSRALSRSDKARIDTCSYRSHGQFSMGCAHLLSMSVLSYVFAKPAQGSGTTRAAWNNGNVRTIERKENLGTLCRIAYLAYLTTSLYIDRHKSRAVKCLYSILYFIAKISGHTQKYTLDYFTHCALILRLILRLPFYKPILIWNYSDTVFLLFYGLECYPEKYNCKI